MGTNRQLHTVRFDEFATNLNAIFDQIVSDDEGVTVEREGKLFTIRPRQPEQDASGGV